jgi:glyoxylase-like metal-dependent hydrolase (beta-lactamase superfamily II)
MLQPCLVMLVPGGERFSRLLTDAHPDRLLSAGILSGSGEAPIVASRAAFDRASAYTDGFWRGVVESWARRFPEVANDLTGMRGVLPEILFTQDLTLHSGEMGVTVRCVPGSAPGSAWVRLPEQDVLFTGDTLVVDIPPIMSATPDTKAWLNTLTSLRRSTFSETILVPGRGPLCDQSATLPLSEYIALARRRVRSLHTAGQARPGMAAVMAEMLSLFSIPEDRYDSAQRRVKAGLDRLYEELRPQ